MRAPVRAALFVGWAGSFLYLVAVMTRLLLPAWVLLAACAGPAASTSAVATAVPSQEGAHRMTYPATRAEPIVDTLHGVPGG